VVLAAAYVASGPVLVPLAALAGRVLRRPQIPVLARVLLAYFTGELRTLGACAGLWLLSGCGLALHRARFVALHWRLLESFVHGVAGTATDALGIQIRPEESDAAERALLADGPLLVFSRHAGPGDTVLVLDQLLTHYHRHPSVVFKEALVLDPSVDVIAHRLPHAVVSREDRERSAERIEAIAGGLGPRGVLLLFPEGGNFSPERRRRAIRRLWRKGERRAARRGERMQHVLPPQPNGALAALEGNPHAPVVFAAHTGLGLAAFPGEIWRDLPRGRTLHTRMWLVGAREIPAEEEARIEWLTDWWGTIDAWVAQKRLEPAEPGA
jgi:1-acyl-sn-glycerol-3-phosphate acyltransferase